MLNLLIHREIAAMAPIDGVSISPNGVDSNGDVVPSVRVDFKPSASDGEKQSVFAYLQSLDLESKARQAEEEKRKHELDVDISKNLVEVFDLLISKGVIIKGDISEDLSTKIDERKAI